jgi:hypothetical protein
MHNEAGKLRRAKLAYIEAFQRWKAASDEAEKERTMRYLLKVERAFVYAYAQLYPEAMQNIAWYDASIEKLLDMLPDESGKDLT